MLLSIVPLPEFAQFLLIILWITIPVLILSLSLTALAHHRRKKKKKKDEENKDADFVLTSPEDFLQNQPVGAQIFFDHTGLIQEYRNKLSYNHARYAALKQDFEQLELKYTATIGSGATLLSNSHSSDMEQSPHEMQDGNILAEEHVKEKEELLARLEQMGRDYKYLETENASLLAQISLLSVVPGEAEEDGIVNQWKEENTVLKGQVVEAEYLKDLVEEKNKQVDFLQKQVELRIKSYHQSEHQREEIRKELESSLGLFNSVKNELFLEKETTDKLQSIICLKEEELAEKQRLLDSLQENINTIQHKLEEVKLQKNELFLEKETTDKLKSIICLKEEELAEKQRLLDSLQESMNTIQHKLEEVKQQKNELSLEKETMDKLQSIIQLKEEELSERQRLLDSFHENMNTIQHKLEEVKQQNEMLISAAAGTHDTTASLKEELDGERSKVKYLEQRLFANKQLLHHLYKEFSACVEENQPSLVIALNPEYSNVAAAGQWDESGI